MKNFNLNIKYNIEKKDIKIHFQLQIVFKKSDIYI